MVDAKTAGYEAAKAKGEAETARQQQEAQQQQQQSRGPSTQGPSSFGGNGRVTFDKSGNTLVNGQIVQFANQQARESYLAERGVGNTGEVVNEGLYQKADFTDIGVAERNQSGQVTQQVIKPVEGYGYSGNAKLSPIVKNFSKTPTETNYDLAKTRDAVLARARFKDTIVGEKPTVETPQSKGKSFGTSWASGQRESIGAKIFSNQIQIKRGSPLEDKIKSIEAAKATKYYPSVIGAKKGYETGGGKVNEPLIGLTDKSASTKVVFRNLNKTLPDKSQGSANDVFAFAAKNNIKTLDVYDTSGNKLGTIQANNQGKNALATFGNTQDLILRTPPTSSVADFSDFAKIGAKGGLITIYEANNPTFPAHQGKYIGFASGKNADFTVLNLTKNASIPFTYQVLYPKNESNLISSVQKNPAKFENLPQSFWQSQGEKGNLSEQGMFKINEIFHAYDKSQNAPAKAQERENAKFLTNLESPGVTFNITDKSGKVLSTTSGQRTRYDFLQAQKKYGNDILISPVFNYTPEQALSRLNEGPKGLNQSEPIKASDVFSGFSKSFLSGTASGVAVLKSAGGFGLSTLRSIRYNPETQQFHVTNRVAEKNTLTDIANSIPGLGFITKLPPPVLTHSAERLEAQYKAPTIEGATLYGENANQSRGYYVGSALATGAGWAVLLEGGYYGAKGVLKATGTGISKTGVNIKVPVQKVIQVTPTGKLSTISYQTKDVFSGLTVFGRPIIGKSAGGWVGPRGAFKGGNLLGPVGSEIVVSEERGNEVYTKPDLTSRLVTNNPSFYEEAGNRGLLARGISESRANQLRQAINKEIMSNKIPQKTKEAPIPSSLTPTATKGAYESIAKQQSIKRILNISTGRVGTKYGSTSTYGFLSEANRAKISPADIDVHATKPLGILEERQAQNAALETNANIQKVQGISPELGTVYRGLSEHELEHLMAGQIRSDIYTTPNIETAAFYGRLNTGPTYKIARLKLQSEQDILKFKNIPKSVRKGNVIGDWRSGNPRLIEYAKREGFLGLRKPIKTGGEETILFGSKLIEDVSVLSPKTQITMAEARRIYAEPAQGATGGKAVEYITSRDEAGGSSVAKSGRVMGYRVHAKTYKQNVPESKLQMRITSGKFQLQSNWSKYGIQTYESAKAQNATPEQLAHFKGGKFMIVPEAFAGKAVERPYLQAKDLAEDLMKNPATKARGEELMKMANEWFDIEAPYYGLSREKIGKTVSSNPEAERQSEQRASSGLLSSAKFSKSGLVRKIGKASGILTGSSVISKKSGLSTSGYSALSGKSGKSGVSNISLRSGISAKSGKTTKSGYSALSDKSGKSNLSDRSGYSALSGKSGKSGKSGRSGYSGYSGYPSKSGTSGSSGVSGISAKSGISGKSGISRGTTITIPSIPTKPLIIIKPGAFTRRPRYRPKEGPTKTYLHNVHNVFAGSLSIVEPRSKRFSQFL